MTSLRTDCTSNPPESFNPPPPSDSPRERLERVIALLLRTRMYVGSAIVVAVATAALSAVIVMRMPVIWKSEATIVYRDTIQTERPWGNPTQRAAQIGPRLKELLEVRSHLSSVIDQFDLYPEIAARSVVDAVEEMKRNVGFRPRKGVTFVISFSHHDPATAQNVTARLAEMIIAEYHRENMESMTLNRDFLRREREQAQHNVEEASRALSSFLVQNPHFQWGANDSPYAPAPSSAMPGAAGLMGAGRPVDPELSAMRQKLGAIEDELRRISPPATTNDSGKSSPEMIAAQKHRDAAQAAVNAAQDALDEKLHGLTPLHPDAVAARARLQAARESLAAAERQVEAAQAQPMPAPSAGIDPRRQLLEAERDTWLRRIDDRFRRLRAGTPSGGSPAESASNGPGGPDAGVSVTPNAPRSKNVVDLETEWHRLRLELERARDHFKAIQTQERTANLSADAAEKKSDDELVILDPAYLPIRPENGRARMILAGVAATLLMSFAVAFLRVLLNDTLFDPHDIRALSGPAVLAELPRMSISIPPPSPSIVTERHSSSDEIPISWQPISTGTAELHALVRLPRALTEPIVSEPYVELVDSVREREGTASALPALGSLPASVVGSLRVLRHRLEQLRCGEHFVVSVVSPGAGEGKTTVALALALILSEAKRSRVALVDGHLGRPALAATLGLHVPEMEGISAQIRRRLEGYRGGIGVVRIASSLVVLAEPAAPSGSSDALHSIHFVDAVRALRATYDYVVIDGAPVLGSGDAHVLESLSDGLIVVARYGVTKGRDLRRAEQQLGEPRMIGTVLNDVPARAQREPTAANWGRA